MSESQLIEQLKAAGQRRSDVVVGIGDDAAVIDMPQGRKLVTCVDAQISGTHFPDFISAYHIGWRSLAVNLSDFAAMGAEPCWATLVLSVPSADEKWVAEFARGFAALADRYDIALVGGDTVAGPVAIAVQLMGIEARAGSLLRRGAVPGDDVWVSGFPGDAAAGLAVLEGRLKVPESAADYLAARFLTPAARMELGHGLLGIASAAIDVSDGLYVDAGRLAAASGVGLEIDMGKLPQSEALRAHCGAPRSREFAATGGDDYELFFTAAPDKRSKIMSLSRSLNMSCTRIGSAFEGETVTCVLESKRWMPSHTGFDHFAIRSGQ